MGTAGVFDGIRGRVVARIMAVHNRDAEQEAIDVLDPAPDDVVVVIGSGPGVGVQLLSTRVGRVVAVDPSAVMVEDARRRNRAAIAAGSVTVHRRDAGALPLGTGEADGVLSVNTAQLWDPLDASVAEVARVLRPGASLVTLTHDWAIERSTGLTVEAWVDRLGGLCRDAGLEAPRWWRGRAERGRAVAFVATRAIAPDAGSSP